jgi:hypothetical protein
LAYCRDLALTRVREMGQRDADQRAGRWGAGRGGDQAGARQGYVMALTSYAINETSVGAALPITDGFLTTPPPKYEIAEWDEGRRCWRRGYFVLRGERDFRDLYCANPSQWGYLSHVLIQNQSLGYRGNLIVVCVPRGSQFSITLSDVENPRAPSANYNGDNYGSFPDWRHTADWPRPPREAERVLR